MSFIDDVIKVESKMKVVSLTQVIVIDRRISLLNGGCFEYRRNHQ